MARLGTGTEQAVPVPQKSSFVGDVLKLTSGATLAQILAVFISPVLSRLFAPEAFGTAAVFGSIVSVISLIVCLRYELAIMLPKDDKDAANLLAVSLFFVGMFTILTAVSVVFLRYQISNWLKSPQLSSLLWLLPIAVLAQGCTLALRYWNTRVKNFSLLSSMRVLSSASMSFTKLGAGTLGYVGAGALVSANVLSPVVWTVGLSWYTWRKYKHLLRQVCWNSMVVELKRYSKFPLISSWAALLAAVSNQTPTMFLSIVFSQTIVGHYAFGMRMVTLPMMLIGSAIGQVFYQRASEKRALGTDLSQLVEGMFTRLLAFGTLPMLMLMLIGPDIFRVVFGPQWVEAGVYTRILVPPLLFNFVIGSLPLFSVLERQGVGLVFVAVLFVGRVTPFAISYWTQATVRSTLLLFSIVNAIIWLWLCFWQFSAVGLAWQKVIVHVGRYLLYAVLSLSIITVAKWGLAWSSAWLLFIAVVASLPYWMIILLQDTELWKVFKKLRTKYYA